MTSRVVVGAIAGAYGVKGEVRLKSFCAEPSDIERYNPLETEDGRVFEITLGRPIKGGFSARLSGIRSKEEAEALKGARLTAAREAMPDLPDDEFYHADLIGLQAVDTGGAQLGRIRAIHDHGAGDILEIEGPGGPTLLPFTRTVVPTIDLGAGRIVVDPPPEN